MGNWAPLCTYKYTTERMECTCVRTNEWKKECDREVVCLYYWYLFRSKRVCVRVVCIYVLNSGVFCSTMTRTLAVAAVRRSRSLRNSLELVRWRRFLSLPLAAGWFRYSTSRWRSAIGSRPLHIAPRHKLSAVSHASDSVAILGGFGRLPFSVGSTIEPAHKSELTTRHQWAATLGAGLLWLWLWLWQSSSDIARNAMRS